MIASSGLVFDLRARVANAGTGPHTDDSANGPWADLAAGRNGTLEGFTGSSTVGWQGSGTTLDPYCLVGAGEAEGSSYDMVNMGDLAAYDLTSLTIEVWLKTTDTGALRGVLDNIVNSEGYMIDLGAADADQGKPRFITGNGAPSTEMRGSSKVNDGSWHHLVCTYDAATTTGKIYIDNGTPASNSSMEVPTAPAAGALKLFGDGSSTFRMAGAIAQARLYNRALSSTEVGDNYAAGVTGPSNVHTPTAGDTWSWSDSARAIPPSRVTKTQSGLITRDDMSGQTKKWDGFLASLSGGLLTVAASDAADYHTTRKIVDQTSKGDNYLGLKDCVVSIDAKNDGAHNGPAHIVLYKDASNYYDLAVAVTALGSSALSDVKSGSKTSRGTVSKGIASAASKRITVRRKGAKLSARVDDSSITEWTDGSPLTGSLQLRLGAPNDGSGTSAWKFDNLVVCASDSLIMRGLPSGYGVRAYDATDTVVASATASGGVATLDMSAVDWPWTGYVRVFSDAGTWASPETDGAYPTGAAITSGGFAVGEFHGGDEFHLDLTAYRVVDTDGVGQYVTTQVGSHEGSILLPDGHTVVGAFMGRDGSVKVWQRDTAWAAGVPSITHVVAAAGTITDQHGQCSMVRTSDGVFHLVTGGYKSDVQLVYRTASTLAGLVSASTTNLGKGMSGALMVDQADTLHLVATRQTVNAYNDQIVYMSKASGGSWTSITVLADAYSATLNRKTGTVSNGATTMTVTDATGIATGQYVSGPGIDTDTTVFGVSGTTITLSKAAIGGATSQQFTFKSDPTGMLYLFDAAIGKEASGQRTITATIGDYDVGNATFKRVWCLHRNASGVWGGLNAGAYTLPLTQSSSFKTTAGETIRDADGSYETRICVDTDNETVHLTMWDLVAGYPKYIAGTKTSGWASPSFSFTGINTHGAIEQVATGEYVFVAASVSANRVDRFRLRTGSWGSRETMISGPSVAPPQWYWAKLTPYTTHAVLAIWQGRANGSYVTDNSAVTGEGTATLFFAEVSAILTRTAGDNWAWSDSVARSASSGRTASDNWAWSDSVERSVSGSSSIRAADDNWAWSDTASRTSTRSKSVGDTWGWSDTATKSNVKVRTSGDAWAWSDSVARSVSTNSSTRAVIIKETYVTSDQFGSKTVESDTFGERTTYIHPESTIS